MNCPECNTDFTPVRHQKFCTTSCGKKHRQRAYRSDVAKRNRENELQKIRYHTDHARHRAYAQKHYEANKASENARATSYRKQNSSSVNSRRRSNYLADPVKQREQSRAYDARKISQSPKLTTIEQMMVDNYYKRAAELGSNYQVDHIIPLDLGGLHAPWNLQVVTKSDNCSKRNSLKQIQAVALV